jgi:hypothetical protein
MRFFQYSVRMNYIKVSFFFQKATGERIARHILIEMKE